MQTTNMHHPTREQVMNACLCHQQAFTGATANLYALSPQATLTFGLVFSGKPLGDY